MLERRDWRLNDAVEVFLTDDGSFLKIKETLTRIGIANHNKKTLYQTAHLLHKKQKYYIIHFKLMFALDRKPAEFNIDDWRRQNTIAHLMEEWGFLTIKNVVNYALEDFVPISHLKILKFSDKENWKLISKYKNLDQRK